MPEINIVTDDWFSVNALSSITVGKGIKIQNQTTKYLRLLESSTKPDITDFTGELISNMHLTEPSKNINDGSLEVWVRNSKEGEGKVVIFVQEV